MQRIDKLHMEFTLEADFCMKARRTASRRNSGVALFPFPLEHLLVPQLVLSTFSGQVHLGHVRQKWDPVLPKDRFWAGFSENPVERPQFGPDGFSGK